MKIIILGAGHTGSALAEYLVADKQNDVTVIDENSDKLQSLQERFDLQVILGKASHPHILESAGAESADMLVAVTSSDEVNMISCEIGYVLFNIPKKVARIRSPEYNEEKYQLFNDKGISIDHIIAPEKLITKNISQLVKYSGTLQFASFYDGKICLAAVMAYYGGALVGNELSELKEHLPHVEVKIVAIYRQNQFIRPMDSTLIEAADIVYFITSPANIKAVTSEFQRLEKPCRHIIISGGGSIAVALAKRLENDYQVKLIEGNPERAERIAEQLTNTTVLHGEPSDQELLSQEQVELTDLFIAVTSDDEANIMASMLAKRMGAKKVIVLIQRQAYLELINDSVIDIAISPQHATISELLSHVRRQEIEKVVSLRQGESEVIEVIAKGQAETSKLIGKNISSLKLPAGATIGAIVRGDDVIIVKSDLTIEANDHLIIFLPDRKAISDIERLL